MAGPGSNSKRWIFRGAKAAIGLAVIVAVGLHVRRTWRDIRERGAIPRVDPGWAAVAIGLYLIGLGLYGLYFVRVMAHAASPVSRYSGLRSYVVSHLGKYVPGKALVVVMRVAMLAAGGARASTATFATFYETILMMAVGGFVAFFGLTFGPSGAAKTTVPRLGPIPSFDLPLGLLGLAMGVAFLILVLPGVFPRLAALAKMPFRSVGDDAVPRPSWGLLRDGVIVTALGWIAMGLSQIAVIRALSPGGLPPSLGAAAVGSVALATVAGFAVPVSPGGLGVREWVLWTSLGSVMDRDLAVLASLGLRLAWVAGEIVAGAIFYAIRPRSAPAAGASPP